MKVCSAPVYAKWLVCWTRLKVCVTGGGATASPGAAVISVTDQTDEARYPSFKGIMAAKKKEVVEWSLADLGLDAGSVGLDAAWSKVESNEPRPPRTAGEIVTDEGDGGVKLVEFLASKKFV